MQSLSKKLLKPTIESTHICIYKRLVSSLTPSGYVPDWPQPRPDEESEDRGSSGSNITPVKYQNLPLVTSRSIHYPCPYLPTKQAWLETLATIEDEKIGILDLHPDIFATYPRLDIIHRNIEWQRWYKYIDHRREKNRYEARGYGLGQGGKPWPQKGTGRARHGSRYAPQWIKGGKAHGLRGPTSYFYMLSTSTRVLGLRATLSVKYAQNDLHIVDSLEIPDSDPKYLESLAAKRNWGYSVLFIDESDILSESMSHALSGLKSFNAMPVYGLNVYSMLKHETLVLTLAAVDLIEKKLLEKMHEKAPDEKFVMQRDLKKKIPDPKIEVLYEHGF